MNAEQAKKLTKESDTNNKIAYFNYQLDEIRKACREGLSVVELCISDKGVIERLKSLSYIVKEKNENGIYIVSW